MIPTYNNPNRKQIHWQAVRKIQAELKRSVGVFGLTVLSETAPVYEGFFNADVILVRMRALIRNAKKGVRRSDAFTEFNAIAKKVGITLSIGTLAAPGSFTATPAGATQINLTWTASPKATTYVIDRATNVGFTTGVALAIYTGSALAFNNTGLTTATQYFYRIRASATSYGPSPYATANATTA